MKMKMSIQTFQISNDIFWVFSFISFDLDVKRNFSSSKVKDLPQIFQSIDFRRRPYKMIMNWRWLCEQHDCGGVVGLIFSEQGMIW